MTDELDLQTKFPATALREHLYRLNVNILAAESLLPELCEARAAGILCHARCKQLTRLEGALESMRKAFEFKAQLLDSLSDHKFIKPTDKIYVYRKSTYIETSTAAEVIEKYPVLSVHVLQYIRQRRYRLAGFQFVSKELKRKRSVISKESYKKRIYCYNMNGDFLREYENAYEATKDTRVSPATILTACNKKNPSSRRGFYWRYSKEAKKSNLFE